uniref:Uncharacterized protein n=1 Tax=Lepeophtheirus salmonis TaxID=72036 RepID=A0A0K2TR76_LEPSM
MLQAKKVFTIQFSSFNFNLMRHLWNENIYSMVAVSLIISTV